VKRYVVMRLLEGLVSLFVLATLVFILARLIGNPVDMMLPGDASWDERERMIHDLGLDRPIYEQYVEFMGGLLTGDLGESIKFKRPIMELFLLYFPNTFKLALVTLAMAFVLGFALGMLSAIHRGSPIDHFSRVVAVIGQSAPVFWIGLMLMLLFAVNLKILPVARMGGWDSYILPAFTSSLFTLAGTARLLRSSMLEVLDTEYVKLARIKGVAPGKVVWKHCLRNAIIPVFTFAGMQLAGLMGGAVVVETVFAWPGVGRLIYQGITGRDYPVVQGCILVVGFMIIAINLIVDILYGYVDPRIRVAGGRR
jgi:ABC-type dipeptide/oligopeptide/nickel transport system permease component